MQRATASASSAPRGSSPRAAELQNIRILLIDDDPQAEALIHMALADAPFRHSLEVAVNGTAGLKRVRDRQHDIYLVDQQLPDSTGLDIIHSAKADNIEQPFILLTGYGSGELDEAALKEGAADYVEKHLVGAHLQRSIRYALRQWQSAVMLRDREDQLRHAQKMEAIGRLAGGVAHDFNNILTAIVGYTELIAERLDPDSPTAKDVGEVRRAADRASALTKQLLSFSRKQFLHPTVLNLNDTVAGMIEMLPRVIGDHIQTTTHLDSNVGLVRADASQMEQVLVNLVLNARDAMPTSGHLTIRTTSVELDEERLAADSLPLAPGRYTMLSVSDTGTGMDKATRERAFEPFFTTKPKGKGTGLGLATVYGIVDQSGGGIALDTAPGQGTSIRIYLPTTDAAADVEQPRAVPVTAAAGKETVLLVDDNDAVRELASSALRRRGYTVVEARSAEEAIEWAVTTKGKPDLLVTDVVMPGLSGPNLAARLLQDNTSLRVLYMSGYTDDATPAHGKFWGGVPLLQKPFSPGQLAERVRLALDSPVNQA